MSRYRRLPSRRKRTGLLAPRCEADGVDRSGEPTREVLPETRQRGRYELVPGDIRLHRRDILALAVRNLPATREIAEARYEKYYKNNPLGRPHLALARDRASQAVVGMATLFPTHLSFSGTLIPAAISGDFAVEPGHRGLGPAVALQRNLLSALAPIGISCAYGSPNESAEPILDRVGYTDVGRFVRFVRIVRTRFLVERYLRHATVARFASAVSSATVDPLLALVFRERRHRLPHGLTIQKPLLFDDTFSDVWKAMSRQPLASSERSSEVLNWKYELPQRAQMRPYRIFALIVDGAHVAGYIVYVEKSGIRHVFDIAFLPSRSIVDALLSEFVLDSSKNGSAAIALLYLGPDTLLTRRLEAFGFFRRREEHGLRVYVPTELATGVDLTCRKNWYFLAGDTDV